MNRRSFLYCLSIYRSIFVCTSHQQLVSWCFLQLLCRINSMFSSVQALSMDVRKTVVNSFVIPELTTVTVCWPEFQAINSTGCSLWWTRTSSTINHWCQEARPHQALVVRSPPLASRPAHYYSFQKLRTLQPYCISAKVSVFLPACEAFSHSFTPLQFVAETISLLLVAGRRSA